MLKKWLIIMASLCSLFGCQPKEQWIEGALYTLPHEKGYTIMKMLKVDNNGVHVRLYSNLYQQRPITVDESELFIAGYDRPDNVALGMGHAPISYHSFKNWGAQLLQSSTVQEEELEGYILWQQANGGYF